MGSGWGAGVRSLKGPVRRRLEGCPPPGRDGMLAGMMPKARERPCPPLPARPLPQSADEGVAALLPAPSGVHTSSSRDSSLPAAPVRGTRDRSGKLSSGLQGPHPGRVTRKLLRGRTAKGEPCVAREPRNPTTRVPPVLDFQVHATVPLPWRERPHANPERARPPPQHARFDSPVPPREGGKHPRC